MGSEWGQTPFTDWSLTPSTKWSLTPWTRLHRPHRPDADDEVLGVTEARSGHPFVLLVVQHDSLAVEAIEHLCDRVRTRREYEFLRCGTRNRRELELALPRFAQPSTLRDLLEESGPL